MHALHLPAPITAALRRAITRSRAWHQPYFHLEGYMLRYWLLGARSPERNADRPPAQAPLTLPAAGAAYRWLTRRLAARVHVILRSDRDRALHDHPWWSLSVVLRGGYWEVCAPTERAHMYPQIYALLLHDLHLRDGRREAARYLAVLARYGVHWRGEGAVVLRGAREAHRLVLPGSDGQRDGDADPVLTLFVIGRKRAGSWGFYPEGVHMPKVPWREYAATQGAATPASPHLLAEPGAPGR